MKNNKKVAAQFDRYSRRFGETVPSGNKYVIDPPYIEPVCFCVSLFRSGKSLADSIYISRLTFTDPCAPHYIPIERWNAELFYRMVIRYIKSH